MPSQLRTQKAGPEPDATWRGGGGLLVEAERIGEEIGLRRALALLLFLDAAEKEIEQALGGGCARRQGDRARERGGGNKRHAAPHALIRQTLYATHTPPNAKSPAAAARAAAQNDISAGW